MPLSKQLIRVGHSPDPDDAFMFHALANGKIDTGNYRFEHELVDIETLNRRALSADLELTAISIHAYAYVHDRYELCSCGASMGDGYGPMVVMPKACSIDDLRDRIIAIPGEWTSAYLALRLRLGNDFAFVVVPFDQIIPAVRAGEYQGQKVDAGLIIHEGQLTYGDYQLQLVVDLGAWWKTETGLPLPLGGNAIRKDLGRQTIQDVQRFLKQSIRYALNHRMEAIEYARRFGRDLDVVRSDTFIGMYVNDWTLDLGPRGRQAVEKLLHWGYEAGILAEPITPEFVV
ncbi:MAG: ABC transporter substrate-binding protein [Pirellulales bacterium]|nr:ABC transporter substrate-binding protein [Pirellulales bacterium]